MTKFNYGICLIFALLTLGAGLQAQQLIEVIPRGGRSLASMQFAYGDQMQYGVQRFKIVYETVDVEGQVDTASGLVVIPDAEGLVFPLLAYQHGTVTSRSDVPSNLAGGYELAEIFAGVGYVSSAADYLGLGESRGIHPYVHAESQAWAAADMLRAVREYCEQNDILLNEQLFITGYSQGGHAGAALHRYLEANFPDEFTVTAASHMSGPYEISGAQSEFALGDDPYSFPAYLGWVFLSYRRVYGLDYDTEEFFKQPYAGWVDEFAAEDIDLIDLSIRMIGQLNLEVGATIPRNMLQDSILTALLTDPDHPVSQALADNDLLDWTPQAPTRLVYCEADDQVFYRNSVVADSVLNLNGAPDLEAVNINPNFDHGQCVEPATLYTLLFFSSYQDLQVDVDELALETNTPIVYPNPARDFTWVDDLTPDAQLQLFDAGGRLLRQYRPTASPARLDLQGLEGGVYLLKVLNGEQTWTRKVVVKP